MLFFLVLTRNGKTKHTKQDFLWNLVFFGLYNEVKDVEVQCTLTLDGVLYLNNLFKKCYDGGQG